MHLSGKKSFELKTEPVMTGDSVNMPPPRLLASKRQASVISTASTDILNLRGLSRRSETPDMHVDPRDDALHRMQEEILDMKEKLAKESMLLQQSESREANLQRRSARCEEDRRSSEAEKRGISAKKDRLLERFHDLELASITSKAVFEKTIIDLQRKAMSVLTLEKEVTQWQVKYARLEKDRESHFNAERTGMQIEIKQKENAHQPSKEQIVSRYEARIKDLVEEVNDLEKLRGEERRALTAERDALEAIITSQRSEFETTIADLKGAARNANDRNARLAEERDRQIQIASQVRENQSQPLDDIPDLFEPNDEMVASPEPSSRAASTVSTPSLKRKRVESFGPVLRRSRRVSSRQAAVPALSTNGTASDSDADGTEHSASVRPLRQAAIAATRKLYDSDVQDSGSGEHFDPDEDEDEDAVTEEASVESRNQSQGTKRHQCPECTYETDNKGSMDRHKRTHTGERPHKCDECEQAFSQKSNLATHKRIHAGEKPYECDECGQAFVRKEHLTTHKASEKSYECDLCDRRFSDVRNHNSHRKTQHL
ncbi:hypothetical protein C8J56DRAFT_1117136 [Mycena floridula]|nr:hypothetical protein C8J56DRAFT_1117136 [Mycena floridula]